MQHSLAMQISLKSEGSEVWNLGEARSRLHQRWSGKPKARQCSPWPEQMLCTEQLPIPWLFPHCQGRSVPELGQSSCAPGLFMAGTLVSRSKPPP